MQILKNLKHIFFIVALTLTIVFGGVFFLSRDFFFLTNAYFLYRSGNNAWQDRIYQHHLTPSKNILLILIDENTVNALQADTSMSMLTIQKTTYARLINILEDAGVAGIAFDIVFQNPDTTEGEFVDTLKKYSNIVIATTDPLNISCRKFTDGTESCTGVPRSVYAPIPWGLIETSGPESRLLGFNISKKTSLAWKLGTGSLNARDVWIPTIPLALVNREDIPGAKKLFSNMQEKNILNPYFGGAYSYRAIPFIQILQNPDAYRDILRGSYVFVGESGELVHDLIKNPVDGALMPGAESHAHFLDGILQDKMLETIASSDFFIIIVVATILMIGVYYVLPKYISPIIFIISMIAVIWIGRYLYDVHRIVIDIVPIFLSCGLLTYPLTYIYKFFIIDRQKRYILDTFSRYLSPEVVKRIDMSQIDAKLGGEKKNLSILFSDIEGFTSISEKLDPQNLFIMMTIYLNKMTHILNQNSGTLDKYIGDAVMGFFGAPIDDSEHALHACTTAIEMREALVSINAELTKNGITPINFRIGIASGDVIVGNIGSADRFNYTVLGDSVNLASRLEGLGREFGVHCIISAETRAAIGEAFIVRELDYIAVRGKNEGVRIFELIDRADSQTNTEIFLAYESALRIYREDRYLDAGTIWEKYIDVDPPSRVMAHRCLSLLQGTTHLDNGVYRMEYK